MSRFLKHILSPISVASLFSLFLLVLPTASLAKTEQDVKAAYLYNFIKFVDWPSAPDNTPQTLCVLGQDAINNKLNKLDQKKVKGRTLNIVTITSSKKLNTQACDILFVGQSEEKFLGDIFSALLSTPTLTVSSIGDFVHAGGQIGFIKLGNVIRFDINLKNAINSDISIRAKLLEIANKVVK